MIRVNSHVYWPVIPGIEGEPLLYAPVAVQNAKVFAFVLKKFGYVKKMY